MARAYSLDLRERVVGLVASGETAQIQWDSIAGHTYKVQYKESGRDWTDCGTATATSNSSSVAVDGGTSERIYRIIDITDVGTND